MNKFTDLLNTKNDKDGKVKYLSPVRMNGMKRASSDIPIERIRNNASMNINTDVYDPNVVYGLGTPIDDNVVAELKNLGKPKTRYTRKTRSKSLMTKKKKRKFSIKSDTRKKRLHSSIVGNDKKRRRYVFNDEEY